MIRLLAVGLVAAAAAVGAFAAGHGVASAQDMQTCPAFTAVKWVSPLPGSTSSGDKYTVTVSASAMPCEQATAWAKKLIAQHIAGEPMQASYPPLTGGPAGYVCKGSPDSSGHAWRGHCLKSGTHAGGDLTPGINWTNVSSP